MTKLMHDEGELHSKFSYVSMRLHPGTKHQCVYLAGEEDCRAWRKGVFDRALGICAYCQQFCGLIAGEAHHLRHFNKIERCWCPENGVWAHPACHRKQHPQVQLRRIA